MNLLPYILLLEREGFEDATYVKDLGRGRDSRMCLSIIELVVSDIKGELCVELFDRVILRVPFLWIKLIPAVRALVSLRRNKDHEAAAAEEISAYHTMQEPYIDKYMSVSSSANRPSGPDLALQISPPNICSNDTTHHQKSSDEVHLNEEDLPEHVHGFDLWKQPPKSVSCGGGSDIESNVSSSASDTCPGGSGGYDNLGASTVLCLANPTTDLQFLKGAPRSTMKNNRGNEETILGGSRDGMQEDRQQGGSSAEYLCSSRAHPFLLDMDSRSEVKHSDPDRTSLQNESEDYPRLYNSSVYTSEFQDDFSRRPVDRSMEYLHLQQGQSPPNPHFGPSQSAIHELSLGRLHEPSLHREASSSASQCRLGLSGLPSYSSLGIDAGTLLPNHYGYQDYSSQVGKMASLHGSSLTGSLSSLSANFNSEQEGPYNMGRFPRFPPKSPSKRSIRAPRMRWTSTLHAHFVQAVELLGGHESKEFCGLLSNFVSSGS